MESIQIIPENAPFSEEQRAWLNGFFIGYLGLDKSSQSSQKDIEEEEDYPWHDDTMPLDERMDLATDRPYNLQLMAAMGQQDCGQCGYICKTYAEAIASGEEEDLTLCSPGGRPTSKQIKKLVADAPAMSELSNDGAQSTGDILSLYSRKNPYPAKLKKVASLNSAGSIKETRHIEIDLADSGIEYQPGDALGVFPKNNSQLVESIISKLNAHSEDVFSFAKQNLSLREILTEHVDITKPSDEVIEYFSECARNETQKNTLKELAEEGIEEGCDLLEVIDEFSSLNIDTQEMLNQLGKLQPRLYSISSTLRAHNHEVHTTVGVVKYDRKQRERLGVASTYFSDQLQLGDTLRIYIQPTHEFLLPSDNDAAVIMVGPGTGIAPFRSFLNERYSKGDTGKNWLFFGNPTAQHDFLYQQEIESFVKNGCLTKLSTAFSRDQAEKIYVQDRMYDAGEELWQWLNDGAYLYVCGDAQRMAKDVDQTLHKIVQEFGDMSEQIAADYMKKLAKEKRYLRDVY